jgi:hypothetical protein
MAKTKYARISGHISCFGRRPLATNQLLVDQLPANALPFFQA